VFRRKFETKKNTAVKAAVFEIVNRTHSVEIQRERFEPNALQMQPLCAKIQRILAKNPENTEMHLIRFYLIFVKNIIGREASQNPSRNKNFLKMISLHLYKTSRFKWKQANDDDDFFTAIKNFASVIQPRV